MGVGSKPHRGPDPSCLCAVLVSCPWDVVCVPDPRTSCPAAVGSPTAMFHSFTRCNPAHLV